MDFSKKVVLGMVVLLFVVWTWFNLPGIASDPDWIIRFVLGSLFALLIFVRRSNSSGEDEKSFGVLSAVLFALGGVVCAVTGIVFGVHQLEWLGLIVLMYAGLRWVMPEASARNNILLGLFIIYWIHPLPGQIFGKLQLGMQYLSVNGAEWFLHCINRRVWADGMILRAGLASFGVPEACSGMRTVVTVMLCTLGVCSLMRFKWYQISVFLFLGLVQVLFLNILRIVFMIIWSDKMPAGWGDDFLHDSLGIFLLISILVVQVEASWWRVLNNRKKSISKSIEDGDVEPPDLATILPRFWMYFRDWWKPVVSVLLVIALITFAFYRKRPYHRAMMIYDVVDDLAATNLEAAERGANLILELLPDNLTFLEKKVHILVMRNKSLEALDVLAVKKDSLSSFDKIMKSWALMSLGRADEAMAVIEGLPDEVKNLPQVAMTRAEFAVMQNRPEDVRRNTVLASKHHSTVHRVRSLFLYLAARGMWDAISDSDIAVIPYREFEQALIVVEANLNLNRAGRAAEAMKKALAGWPNEMRLLHSLFMLAKRQSGGQWENIFAENLKANIHELDVDRLAAYIDYCFQLRRPDLAWLSYSRLRQIDPDDPSLFLMPAQYGDLWFTFYKHGVGLKAVDSEETVDLRSFCRLTRRIEPVSRFWDSVPLVDELSPDKRIGVRKKYMDMCLAELWKMRAEGRLSWRTRMMFPMVLAMSGDFDSAHAMQDEVMRGFPEMRVKSILRRAQFYTWQGRWDDAYEMMLDYRDAVQVPDAESQIMFVTLLMNMNMGVHALDAVDRFQLDFPDLVEPDQLRGLIWNAFGFKEHALFILGGRRVDLDDSVWAQLLYETGRYSAAEKVVQVSKVDIDRRGVAAGPVSIVPAEDSLAGRWPRQFDNAGMDAEAARWDDQAKKTASPFMKAYQQLTARWYMARGKGGVSNPETWIAAGRNDSEKAEALHQLTILLAGHGDKERALSVARQAVGFLPGSPVLWRTFIALSGGDSKVVEQAFKACPADPEIWLAWLVVRCRAKSGDKDKLVELDGQLMDEMQDVVEKKLIPAGTAVRAGDLMLRLNVIQSASILAGYAIKHGEGYLPAYILGLRCALLKGDRQWALQCALGGVENAIDPSPFYKTIVIVKSAAGDIDADLIRALEYLKEQFPEDIGWTEGLGYAYFRKGDLGRSMSILHSLFSGERAKDAKAGSLMLTAEVARHEGRESEAVRVLRMARGIHPDDHKVLNNLIYNLAQNPATVPQAMALLTDLLEVAGEDFIVYDTAAMVYMRAGQMEKANFFMKKALELLEDGSAAALEVKVNSAEIMFRMGDYTGAKAVLQGVRAESSRSRLLDRKASELLAKIEEIMLLDKRGRR